MYFTLLNLMKKTKLSYKMKNKLKFLLIPLMVMFFGSCMQEVTLSELENIKIEKNSNSLDIVLYLKINNPNAFKIKVQEINVDLTLNSWEVGEVISKEEFVLKPNSNDVYPVPVNVDFGNILTGGAALISLFSSDKATVKILGDIKAKAFFISKTIKIDETKEVSL